MSNVWFSSDWHLGHNNIVRGASRWEDKSACRNFDTLEAHDETLLQNINKNVKKTDYLYFLGDFSMGGRDNVRLYRERINCKNIYFILGNHDIHIRKNAGNCRDLFLSVDDVLYKRIGAERFVLCHYSMRTWADGHHGAIMLYGHSHGTLTPYAMPSEIDIRQPGSSEIIKQVNMQVRFKTMDVGVDTHSEFRPYHIDEIRDAMTNCIPLRVDHHEHDEVYV